MTIKQKVFIVNIILKKEIYEVIKLIVNVNLFDKSAKLSLESLKVDEKTNETCSFALKNSLKNNIVDYFNYIKKVFIEINKTSPSKFEFIATQIKAFYLSCMQINTNQEWIYQEIVEWLYKKTNSHSRTACEVIVAFFVQNCEVFS